MIGFVGYYLVDTILVAANFQNFSSSLMQKTCIVLLCS